MTTIRTRQKQRRYCTRYPRPQIQSVKISAVARCVLIAEHRDEVFARLAHDLGATGHVVFRATRAEEVPLVYAVAKASLAICNSELPDASGWLTSTKLRMHRTDARVWLYSPQKDAFDVTWARLSGVERILYYQGDLFRLADQVSQNILWCKFSLSAFVATVLACSGTTDPWGKIS